MSVPAEEMRRRVPVARPAVQQLALPAPAPAPAPPAPGTPPTTVVPPRADVVMAGQGERGPSMSTVANVRQPGAAPAAAAMQQAPRPTVFVTPAGTAATDANVARSAATRERMAAGRPPPAAAPAAPRGTPAAQVRFDPNPRRPTDMPGARPAAATMGAPPPAAAPAATPARGAAPAAPAAASARPMSRNMRAAGALGVGLETLNVVGAGREGGASAAAQETGRAATRLGAAAAGARLGGFLGPYGAAAGGVIGYAGGNELVQQLEDPNSSLRRAMAQYGGARPLPAAPGGGMFMAPSQIAAGQAEGIRPQASAEMLRDVPAAQSGARPPGGGGTGFENVVSGASSVPAAGAAVPPGGRAEITADGVTRVIEGEELAAIGRRANVIPAYQGAPAPAAQALAAPAVGGPSRFADSERRQHMERIDKLIQDIGPLDRRGRRDAVTALMGLRGRAIEGNFNASNEQAQLQAQLAARAAEAQLGADVNREQIAASRQARTQTVTGDDGTVYAVDGATAAPLTIASTGQPLRTATRQDDSLQRLAAQLLQADIAAASNPLAPGTFDPRESVERAASAATLLQQHMSAPPGYSYAGSQNGVPVYRDAQGNLIQPNNSR